MRPTTRRYARTVPGTLPLSTEPSRKSRSATGQRARPRTGDYRGLRLGDTLYGDWLYDAAWLVFWWPWFPHWQGIDITAELERHWEQHGGLPSGLHHRLQAYLVHIGLDALAYNAYRGRWDDLVRTASQTSQLIADVPMRDV